MSDHTQDISREATNWFHSVLKRVCAWSNQCLQRVPVSAALVKSTGTYSTVYRCHRTQLKFKALIVLHVSWCRTEFLVALDDLQEDSAGKDQSSQSAFEQELKLAMPQSEGHKVVMSELDIL